LEKCSDKLDCSKTNYKIFSQLISL
jgi:hypothetical protein